MPMPNSYVTKKFLKSWALCFTSCTKLLKSTRGCILRVECTLMSVCLKLQKPKTNIERRTVRQSKLVTFFFLSLIFVFLSRWQIIHSKHCNNDLAYFGAFSGITIPYASLFYSHSSYNNEISPCPDGKKLQVVQSFLLTNVVCSVWMNGHPVVVAKMCFVSHCFSEYIDWQVR